MRKQFIFFCVLLFATIQLCAQDTLIPFRVQDKWGYSDYRGKLIIQPQFEEASFFLHMPPLKSFIAITKKKGKKGVINKSGKNLLPFLYEEIVPGFDNHEYTDCFIARKNGKYGVVTGNNKTLLPFLYDSVQLKEEYQNPANHRAYTGYSFAVKKQDRYYLIKRNGKQINLSKEEFDKTEQEEWATADMPPEPELYRLDNIIAAKTAILTRNPDILDDIANKWYTQYDEAYLPCYKNGKAGLISYQELEAGKITKVFIPLIHDEIISVNGTYLLRKGNQLMWYGYSGNLLDSLPVTAIEKHAYNEIITRHPSTGLLGLYRYNGDGTSRIPEKYEHLVRNWDNGYDLYRVQQNGKSGFIRIDGFEYFKD